MLHTLAGIAWDPQLRGILATAVGVVVLMGSVHLLLATNLGNRLGFLLASAAFFGWLTIMGGVWWVYGTIGMIGQTPSWNVVEVLVDDTSVSGIDEVRALRTDQLPPADEINDMDPADLQEIRDDLEATTGGWRLLPEADRAFGEAKAAVDEYIAEHPVTTVGKGSDGSGGLDDATDYVTSYSFERGGKTRLPADPSRIDRILNKLRTTFLEPTHPTRYAVIQLQPVIPQQAEPGQAPPPPEPDPSEPLVSVVMKRDLGQVRLPGAALTIASGIVFALLCVQLHRRDQRVAEVRALEPTGG